MACDGLKDDFTEKVLPQPPSCTCNQKCSRNSRGNGALFLAFFVLSLSLHGITLICYLDLRFEVKREISLQKRDAALKLDGTEVASPVLSYGQQTHTGDGAEGPEVNIDLKSTIATRQTCKRKGVRSVLATCSYNDCTLMIVS